MKSIVALRLISVSLVCCSYAITVWYFDAKERSEAKEKYRLGKLLRDQFNLLFLKSFSQM